MGQDNSKNTTGHVWDDDLQELTNPLPNWWLWTFYITIVFSVIYWIMYPAWPIGQSYTKGVKGVNEVTYTNNKGEAKTTHWNMRSDFMADMNTYKAEQKQWFDKVAATSYEDVSRNADLMQFVNSAGKQLFADNCAGCHMAGGQGKIGLAPNLVDDSWIFGGSHDKIYETLTAGRKGYMPPRGGSTISDAQVKQVSHYVLSLSGDLHDAEAAKAGEAIFHGEGMCLACHGPDGKGIEALGSANLTDKIWLWADINALPTAEAKADALTALISAGLNKGVMPAWSGRLTPEQIKLLTVYVHDSLGGGK